MNRREFIKIVGLAGSWLAVREWDPLIDGYTKPRIHTPSLRGEWRTGFHPEHVQFFQSPVGPLAFEDGGRWDRVRYKCRAFAFDGDDSELVKFGFIQDYFQEVPNSQPTDFWVQQTKDRMMESMRRSAERCGYHTIPLDQVGEWVTSDRIKL